MISSLYQQLDHHLERTQLLPPNASIVVAVSGGVDSVVLLDLLTQLQKSYGWIIHVAHLDHKVRTESEVDAQLVADLAERHGHKYYLGQLDGSLRSEASMRRARYDFLESIREGAKADWIVTAHHRDDRIETSVFNAIRGADRHGLTALKPVRGKIVRPLLPFSKGQLITHAHTHKLAFVEDHTNADPSYSRNLVRHELLPHATTYDPRFQQNYLRQLDGLDQLNSDIDHGLDEVIRLLMVGISHKNQNQVRIDRRGFLKLPPLVQLNVVVHIAHRLAPGIGLSTRNIAQMQNFLPLAKTGSNKALAGGFEVARNYDQFVFQQNESIPEQSRSETLALHPGELQEFGAFNLGVNALPSRELFAEVWLKPQSLYVRTWHKGDRIYPIGLGGSKKLQDIFGDKKIPRPDRASWPVIVTARNEVIWVPALAIDSRFVAEASADNYHVICEVI